MALTGVFDSALTLIRDVLAAGHQADRDQPESLATTIRTISIGGCEVRTASGMRVLPDAALTEVGPVGVGDIVIVPGYGSAGDDPLHTVEGHLTSEEGLTAGTELRRFHANGATIAAGCTATFLLAEHGLLDGLQATTSWWASDAFRARYPAVDLQPHMMLTRHERIVCAGAALAHMDLGLWVLGSVYGPRVADQVARTLLLDERTSQARYMATDHLTNTHVDIHRAEAWIRAHIAEPIHMADIASALAMSPRTLTRRFSEATGAGPLRFLQRLRIEHAIHLLATSDLAFAEIAARVGYSEPVGLRRILRRETGRTPSSFRQGPTKTPTSA